MRSGFYYIVLINQWERSMRINVFMILESLNFHWSFSVAVANVLGTRGIVHFVCSIVNSKGSKSFECCYPTNGDNMRHPRSLELPPACTRKTRNQTLEFMLFIISI